MNRINLNRRLSLEAARSEGDGGGGFSAIWEVLGTVWAEIAEGTGREAETPDLRAPFVPVRITVRAAPEGAASRPRAGQRFRDATRVFRILAVTTRDRRGRYLVCHAQEEGAA